jgi:transposase
MDMRENAQYIESAMRGVDTKQSSMMCLLSPESVVPERHPLRVLLPRVDEILRRLSPVFDEMYSVIGRPSIPPERLLKGTLLMALYTIRSERQLCDQLGYNLLFRWFLGMDMVEPTFNHSTFSQNRERLLAHDVAGRFFREVVELARGAGLMSDDHFTVDGTLIDAWASIKSFQPKKAEQGEEQPTKPKPGVDPNNEGVNFRGEHRSNETHASTTDPEARLMRKGRGKEAKLSYSAHALMENRNGRRRGCRRAAPGCSASRSGSRQT